MKRSKVLLVVMVVLLISASAQAQQRSPNPQGQQQTTQSQDPGRERARALSNAAVQLDQLNDQLNNVRQQYALTIANQAAGGAWWTNTALVARLGITDEQKAKIERAFENHRQKLTSSTELVNKEEAALNRLLQTEPIDRNAILTQTDRVIFARGELERENSAMTLEMRESLTLAQWLQVPQPNSQLRTVRYATAPGLRGGATPSPAPAGAGGRGGPGQRSGGQRQQ